MSFWLAKLLNFSNFASLVIENLNRSSKNMAISEVDKFERGVYRSLRSGGFKRVIVAVSGGADSVALLSSLASVNRCEIIAAHCNFHLRGEESMRDYRVVRNLAAKLGVPFVVADFDVPAYMAQRKGCSLEMACRELRYEWFDGILQRFGADRIATGHNADDNIETLFLNLLRGSGTSGLKGMVMDNGKIWRPLLDVHRNEILEYLKDKNVGFITDSSNLTSDYRRNFLRNEVLPLLRSRWKGADKALDRTLRHLSEENAVISAAVNTALPEDGKPLDVKTALSFASPELLVRKFIESSGPFTTTAAEVVDAMRAAKPAVRVWRLRKGCLELRGNKLIKVER